MPPVAFLASAGIVDAQSIKGADTVGAATRGYDAGKKSGSPDASVGA